jgi:hypothetical protein
MRGTTEADFRTDLLETREVKHMSPIVAGDGKETQKRGIWVQDPIGEPLPNGRSSPALAFASQDLVIIA